LAKIAENCDHNIDPRLGEISPINLTSGSLKKYTSSSIFWATVSTESINVGIKIVLVTFSAISSQTHLVTLLDTEHPTTGQRVKKINAKAKLLQSLVPSCVKAAISVDFDQFWAKIIFGEKIGDCLEKLMLQVINSWHEIAVF
jgi:hypothetical protein